MGWPHCGQSGALLPSSTVTASTLPCSAANIWGQYSCSTSRSNCMNRDGCSQRLGREGGADGSGGMRRDDRFWAIYLFSRAYGGPASNRVDRGESHSAKAHGIGEHCNQPIENKHQRKCFYAKSPGLFLSHPYLPCPRCAVPPKRLSTLQVLCRSRPSSIRTPRESASISASVA